MFVLLFGILLLLLLLLLLLVITIICIIIIILVLPSGLGKPRRGERAGEGEVLVVYPAELLLELSERTTASQLAVCRHHLRRRTAGGSPRIIGGTAAHEGGGSGAMKYFNNKPPTIEEAERVHEGGVGVVGL